jgi:hypothetical protein
MGKPKKEDLEEQETPQGQYDEDAFNQLVESDPRATQDEDDGILDTSFDDESQEGAEGDDGKPADTETEEQPEGAEDDDGASDEGADDPKASKEDGPELPAWIEAIPEDQRDAAVTELIGMHQAIDKMQTRYQALHGQLAPTQRKLSKLEEVVRHFSTATRPGDDLKTRRKALDSWIEKHGEDYPDEATELKDAFEAYASAVEPDAEKYRTNLTRTDDDDVVDTSLQRRLLERMDGEAAQINADPRFASFLKQHPDLRVQAQSPFAHDVIEVLDKFREQTEWQPPLRAEEFATPSQMLSSHLLPGWAAAIGMSVEQIARMSEVDKGKVLYSFKKDLEQAYVTETDDDDDAGDDGNDAQARKLAEQRSRRLQDRSPKARKTGTRGGAGELTGEALFDSLDV